MLRLVLGAGLELKDPSSGVYDKELRTLELPVLSSSGEILLIVVDPGGDLSLQASVGDGRRLAAEAYLALIQVEQFLAASDGAVLQAMDGRVKVTFPPGALAETRWWRFMSQTLRPCHQDRLAVGPSR